MPMCWTAKSTVRSDLSQKSKLKIVNNFFPTLCQNFVLSHVGKIWNNIHSCNVESSAHLLFISILFEIDLGLMKLVGA